MTASSDKVRYRSAQSDDWDAIAALVGHGDGAGRRLLEHLQRSYDPWVCWVGESGAVSRGGAVLGAVVAGAPRGAASTDDRAAVAIDRRVARVVWIGVAPRFRRQGVATRLLQLAEEELRPRKYQQLTAEVEGRQAEALAFFRARGFETESQTLELVLEGEKARALVLARPAATRAVIRPLGFGDISLLGGLLIELGIERAGRQHDALESLTRAQVEGWLQRAATVPFAAWEQDDPTTPLGLAWATRRASEGVLQYVGVQEDWRRQGIGRALLAAIVADLDPPSRGQDVPRPMRTLLKDAGEEQEFFRALGFEVEGVSYVLARSF